LTQRCQYFVFDDFIHVDDKDKVACDDERVWAQGAKRGMGVSGK